MAPNLVKCPRCGKIFASKAGKTLCAKCNSEFLDYGDRVLNAIEKHGLRTPEEIAEFTGVPLDSVIDLVENSRLLSHEIDQDRLCASCKERPAQKYCEYCFHCRLTLNRAFGDAAKLMSEIRDREERLKKLRVKAPELTADADKATKYKRDRKRLRPPDPTPRNRYSP